LLVGFNAQEIRLGNLLEHTLALFAGFFGGSILSTIVVVVVASFIHGFNLLLLGAAKHLLLSLHLSSCLFAAGGWLAR